MMSEMMGKNGVHLAVLHQPHRAVCSLVHNMHSKVNNR